MLSPEEDFGTWSLIFEETCAPNGDYLLFLPDFIRLIEFYSENSSLPESISDFTDQFSNTTAISLLNQMLNLSSISEEEMTKLKESIKQIILSSSNGYKKNVPFCDKILLKCLQDDQPLYQKNYYCYSRLKTPYTSLYAEIFQYFVKENPLQNLIAVVDAQPNINTFSFLASILVNKSIHFEAKESNEILERVQNSLINFFSQFDNTNLRDSDKINLSEIIKFVSQYITSDEAFSKLRDSLLDFGNLCLRSSYVDKNLIGSEIFSRISQIYPDHFQKYAKDTELLQYILSNEFHDTVLMQLASISGPLFKDDQPSIGQLLQIYGKIELSHSVQKSSFEKFLANILSVCNEETIKLFLSKLIEEKKLTSDLISFLKAFINEGTTKNPEGVQLAINYILSLLDRETDDFSMAREAIDSLCKCTLTVPLKTLILDFLIRRISSAPFHDYQYHSVRQLVKVVILTGGEEVKRLIETCIANNQEKLVKTIVMHSYVKLPQSVIEKLTINNEGWSILSKVIKKRGFSVFESFNGFSDIVQELNIEEASMTQFLVVKEFLLTQGVQSKKLTSYATSSSIGSYYKVVDPQIDGLDIVLKFITLTKDEKVNNNALLFLLELYKDVPKSFLNIFAHRIYDYLHSEKFVSISKTINNENADSVFPPKEQLILSKYLKMVNSMIESGERDVDLDDFNIKRHKPGNKNHITFTVKFGNEVKEVTCSSSITGNDLYSLVARKFNRKKEYFSISVDNGSSIGYSEAISKSGVSNKSVLTVADPGKYPRLPDEEQTCMTKIISSNETPQIYFDLIRIENLVEDLKESIWKFLMLMPSIPNISAESLNNAKSNMEIRYIIQYFSMDLSKNLGEDLYDKIIDMICHGQIKSYCLKNALTLIRFHMNFKSEENGKLFINLLLNSLLDEKLIKIRQLIIDVLITFSCRYQPFLTSELLSDEERFDNIILKTPMPHFPRLSAVFSHLLNFPKAFSMLIPLIDKVVDRSDIVGEFFTLLMSIFNDNCNFDAAINACINLLEQNDGQSSPKFICCSFLSNIFSKKPTLIRDCSNRLFKPLLQTVFLLSNTEQQETIINLLLLFCNDDENNKNEFFNALYDHFDSIKTDRWGYDPAMNTKSSTGFNGLRNMGATCYMNSVFQQLFFNSEFTRNLLKSRYEEGCLIQLRALFIKMMKSIRGVVDTSGFVTNWKPNNIPVNPREQQDACEFLLLLLDKLHDELYKGEQVFINEGENDEYRSESFESFWNITLEIKGLSSFEESFASYFQKMSISGYFAENLNRKINILRYLRIRKAPKFLVIQLNRFEYDISTWRKIKINDKYVFPLEFDLKPLTEMSEESNSDENENEKLMYSLVGIIIHCGTTEGGHYQSYIKHCGKWFNFNDSAVSEANEKTLLEEAYGTNKTSNYYDDDFNRQSAYILFYVSKDKLDSVMEDSMKSLEEGIDKEGYDSELIKEIEEDNKEYSLMQSAFGTAMEKTVINMNDIKLSTTYFLNIFTHSRENQMTKQFSDHFLKLLESNKEYYDEVMSIFTQKSIIIFESFVHADGLLSKSIQEVVNHVIDHCSLEKGREFATQIMNYIPSVLSNWRCIHRYLETLINYCNRDVEYCCENEWPVLLCQSIISTLEGTKSSIYLKNVDFSSYFMFISKHINENILDKEILNNLCSLSNQILQSTANSSSFMELLQSCNNLGIIDLQSLFDKLISSSKDISPSLILSLSSQLKSGPKLFDLVNNTRFHKFSFVDSMSKILGNSIEESPAIRKQLLDNQMLLFYLITCDDHNAVDEMEALYLFLFPNVVPLHHYPRAEDSNEVIESTWKDPSPSIALDTDYIEMNQVVLSFIQGISEMNEHPEKFFYGQKLNEKFNQMIRVFIWLILRTQFVFVEEQMKVILQFFDTLQKQPIENNSMIIEYIRVLRFLSPRNFIIDDFAHLVNIIFSFNLDDLLTKVEFVVFFESLKNDLIENPDLFEFLIGNEHFQKAFAVTAKSESSSSFKKFTSIFNKLKFDISDLIMPNIEHLAKNHVYLLFYSLPYADQINSTKFIDAPMFDKLISYIFILVSNKASSSKIFEIKNCEVLKNSFIYLHNEFIRRKGQILINKETNESDSVGEDVSTVLLSIPFVCTNLLNQTYSIYFSEVSQFLIDVAVENQACREELISTLMKNVKEHISMSILIKIGDANTRNEIGNILSTFDPVFIDALIMEVACFLVIRDGIQEWTSQFLDIIISSQYNFCAMIPAIYDKMADLVDKSEIDPKTIEERKIILLDMVVDKNPQYKYKLLANAHIAGEEFDKLKDLYGAQCPHLFLV